MAEEANSIILFDGVCNLCNGFVQFVIKRDPESKFRFASLQGKSAQVILKNNIRESALYDSVVFVSRGLAWQKSDAVLNILKEMGGLWKVLFVFKLMPRFLRDAVYDFIAANRYRLFGKRDNCMVPTTELKSRFLDD